ncbi:MAG: ATP-grasp domain-containing protein, partial [Pseudomonadota bacterium]
TRYTDAPVSYAWDVGVVDHGHTQLVEINDSYATGAYGLAPALYASLIDARWQEIRQHQTGTAS